MTDTLEVMGSLAFFILLVALVFLIYALIAKAMNVKIRTRTGTFVADPDTLDKLLKKTKVTRELSRMILDKVRAENLSSFEYSTLFDTDPDPIIIMSKKKTIEKLFTKKAISPYEKSVLEKELVRHGNDGSPYLPF